MTGTAMSRNDCSCQYTDLDEVATVVAAQMLLPGDARDLSYLLEATNGAAGLRHGALPAEPRAAALAQFIRSGPLDGLTRDLTRLVGEWRKAMPDLRTVTVTDPCYPSALKCAYDRPPLLFVRGCFDDLREGGVAIVGSRSASETALAATYDLAQQVAKASIPVVSGLALGTDSAAHEGALSVGGSTVAVLPTGIDEVYPAENADLAEQIRTNGTLVSQFLPATPSTWSTFLLRNAVISGLSRISVVMSGEERSGTQDEVEHAVRQGRPVAFWSASMATQPWARSLVDASHARFFGDSAEIVEACRAASPL
jgi:DNA processing protein